MQQGSDFRKIAGKGSRPTSRRRVALTPHKGEIERWVAQDYSDAWIASALGTSPSSVQSFRSRHDIYRAPGRRDTAVSAGEDTGGQAQSLYEGVLEHGEQSGYGLWLDPSVADDVVFQRGFTGVSDINVSIEKDRIVLTPAEGVNAGGAGGASVEEKQRPKPGLTDFEQAAKSTLSSSKESGRLKFFDGDKGFGFIIREDGEEIFFHRTELKTVGEPAKGEELSYEVSSNDRGLKAIDVRATP